MARLLIGDFRSASLQAFDTESSDTTSYLIEATANCQWFADTAVRHINTTISSNDSVIILLGFNDCVNSCIWDCFSIEEVAANLVSSIESVVEENSGVNFYVCSIPTVTEDYPIAASEAGLIKKEMLNAKIALFNATLETKCEEIYLDLNYYLNLTEFTTVDGIRFTKQTCNSIGHFLDAHIQQYASIAFTPRTTAPVVGSTEVDAYWLGTKYGGLNPFYDLGQNYAKCAGDTLPNCTAYAWGRFYEILGTRPNLSTGNAEQWYGKNDGYERGSVPRLGAVICWRKGASTNPSVDDGAGHVAIVEQINSDGSILTSESGWNSSAYWWTRTRTKGADGNWGAGSAYTFQGFIYNPAVTASGNALGCVTKSQVTSNNASLSEEKMKLNARYIWQYLGSKGWSLNAVSAMLGNMQNESSINPGRYEAYTYNTNSSMYLGPNPTDAEVNYYLEAYKSKKGRYPGYGIVQWTSTDISKWSNHKFIKWCNNRNLDPKDIDSALQRIEYEVENGGQWYGYAQDRRDYPISFKEFTTSKREPEWLAAAFLLRYEIPGNRYEAVPGRQKNARKWYEYLLPYAPNAVAPASLLDFKVVNLQPTSAIISFLAVNIDKCVYKLYNSANTQKVLDKKELTLTITENKPEVISFECEDLVPNTAYTITLEPVIESDSEQPVETISFSTLQSLPASVSALSLTVKDASLPYDNFQLNASPVSDADWGYWKYKEHNDYGYVIQLIVNGKIKNSKTVTTLPKNLGIKSYFGYETKIGDVVQIGLRAWVKDSEGNKIFDGDYAKTTTPVNLLVRPVITYLTAD